MPRKNSATTPSSPLKWRGGNSSWPPEPLRVEPILNELTRLYGEASCELVSGNPFQLLCATILSAQCTDERVNKVTPVLFSRFPTPEAMARANQPEVEAIIHSTGFFRHKAKNLLGTARLLTKEFQGIVPSNMDDLLRLPGVARKTANVVLGTAYRISSGVVVDTHVSRLSQRLALTRATTPERIEQDLMAILPKTRWILFSHQLILHGRRLCHARKPLCKTCPLVPYCPSVVHSV